MKKWHIGLIVLAIVVVAAVLSVVFLVRMYRQSTGAYVIDALRMSVESANYCEVDADCAPLGPVCPFGCGLVVNRNERQRVLDEIRALTPPP